MLLNLLLVLFRWCMVKGTILLLLNYNIIKVKRLEILLQLVNVGLQFVLQGIFLDEGGDTDIKFVFLPFFKFLVDFAHPVPVRNLGVHFLNAYTTGKEDMKPLDRIVIFIDVVPLRALPLLVLNETSQAPNIGILQLSQPSDALLLLQNRD